MIRPLKLIPRFTVSFDSLCLASEIGSENFKHPSIGVLVCKRPVMTGRSVKIASAVFKKEPDQSKSNTISCVETMPVEQEKEAR